MELHSFYCSNFSLLKGKIWKNIKHLWEDKVGISMERWSISEFAIYLANVRYSSAHYIRFKNNTLAASALVISRTHFKWWKVLFTEIYFKSVTVYVTLPPNLRLAMVMMSETYFTFLPYCYYCSNNQFPWLGINAWLPFCGQYLFSPIFCWVILSVCCHNSTKRFWLCFPTTKLFSAHDKPSNGNIILMGTMMSLHL